ncbi:hypothetical protein LUZ60_016524 [Juncus effusus]|nr:hypothetical protein LUZ60_016524 [Juncus effusus]
MIRDAGGKHAEELNNWGSSLNFLSGSTHNDAGVLPVVATLVVTITFEAALNPPGGTINLPYEIGDHTNRTWSTSWRNPHPAGMPVLIWKLKAFFLLDTVALFASVTTILFLLSGLPQKSNFVMKFLAWLMWFALFATVLAFFAVFNAIYRHKYSAAERLVQAACKHMPTEGIMGAISYQFRLMIILLFCLVLMGAISISLAQELDDSVLAADHAELDNSALYHDAFSCTDDLKIEYPFGLSDYLHGFRIFCDFQQNTSATVTLGTANVTLAEISREGGYIRVYMRPSMWRCGEGSTGDEDLAPGQTNLSLVKTPFTYSPDRNKFTVIGCDSLVVLNNTHTNNESTGCASFCPSKRSIPDGNCMGAGCCQSSIPSGLKTFDLSFYSISNLTRSRIGGPSGCTRSFVVQTEEFQFKARYAKEGGYFPPYFPVVLDWSIGTEKCATAKHEKGFVCQENSDCYDTPNGIGYRCNCREGYAGNPYLNGSAGCQDVDECDDPKKNRCIWKWKCVNTQGSYKCHCPPGKHGDGMEGGTGCAIRSPALEIGLIVGLLVLFMLFTGSSLIYWASKYKKNVTIRRKYFMKNGGMLLQQRVSSRQPSARIFTIEEIIDATNNFKDDQILGKGGYGTVYKGLLPNGEIVAIKKSKLLDETQIDQFINEVVVLSQINHRNVVKLIGCCLEDQVPLLVYEFIPNGTLFHHIHENKTSNLSWEKRLTIAAETAGAIAYLHCKTSIPIIHRDIKSANILLDDNYNAKVSDFGASRLVGFNETHITTIVQGTLGYLDPEYFHTSQLTEKSDVYSFGVVLMEILTGEMPVSVRKCEADQRNLASYFVRSLKRSLLLDVIDRKLINQVEKLYLFAVADIASRCVRLKAEERPTMREVKVELDALRRLLKRQCSFERVSEKELQSVWRENLSRELSPEISLLSSTDKHQEWC